MHNPDKIINAIKNGDNQTLEKVYHFYRSKFSNYVYKNHSALRNHPDEIVTIYQDILIALSNNIKSGRLTSLQNASLESYLFTIGNNLIRTYLKQETNRKRRIMDTPVEALSLIADSPDFMEDKISRNSIFFKEKIFPQLGKKCQQLLELFYYRGFAGEEIAAEMNFNSANAVIVQKKRCINKLKQFKTAIIKQLNS